MVNYTSEKLVPGAVYTREDLKQRFDITDATIKTGIFQPKGTHSVWLFLTEHKTKDRTQFVDLLSGDTLQMQGQKAGRKDKLLIDHKTNDLELLVFYRRKKYEHPGAGFRFEGIFDYVAHTPDTLPTPFVLHRRPGSLDDGVPNEVPQQLNAQGVFDPVGIEDARHREFVSIVRRRGQPRFRKELLRAYQNRCAITGCAIEAILEAAHIHPYQGDKTNVVSNGLLLRADIHTLFDLNLLWIEPDTLQVRLADILLSSEYASLNSKPLTVPANEADHPSTIALASRLQLPTG
ncbi:MULTISPECIES: HNH endonuclease [unclassified Pseudomonas]|uniref:HNH endonuclease n=1 Tax=unclassified Pseudomonas TaxID=196821 RepID=UPI0021C7CC30|nr:MULTISPECIES: HNH endonuclease [unclassified Pseudomonas]MCU1733610.1 HNH endonuclease [Pseudomonas sp. 20P_3.2_Bac4]MCU1743274.1 HNH endonuclease [Pseudomonas sp. 20P_3.2_Bac5]